MSDNEDAASVTETSEADEATVTPHRRRIRLPGLSRRKPSPTARGYLVRGSLSLGALTVAAVGLAALGGFAVELPDKGLPQPSSASVRVPAALPSVPVPTAFRATGSTVEAPAPAQAAAPQTPQEAYGAWAQAVSRLVDIPERSLVAYAHAHTVLAQTQPNCKLTWVTLAGIARIESNHGRFQGRTVGPDGKSTQPIIGIPLNGGPSVRAISDTDGGLLDADTTWDRAVGPFQFIPSTWARWRSDGDGDGVGDPQDIDDAAVSAGRYLCAGGRDLASGDGWLQSILSYNNSTKYADDVYRAAQGYAKDAQQVS